ncbi:MAG: GNAT family N-acetyltransferase, partial [Angustibacter sp.]
MSLRPLRWWDVDTLVAVEREIFGPEAWSAASWWSELAQQVNGRRYLGYIDAAGELQGYGGIQLGLETEIMTLAVRPDARGRGIARELLRQLLGMARAAEASAVLLEVRADNTAAQALY